MHKDGFKPEVDLYTETVSCFEKTRQPLRAVRLMESMQAYGYDFYEIRVLNTAFTNALKLVNVVGTKLREDTAVPIKSDDWKDKIEEDTDPTQLLDGLGT